MIMIMIIKHYWWKICIKNISETNSLLTNEINYLKDKITKIKFRSKE